MSETPEEGMRVHAYSADKKKDLGLGTIEKVEPLRIEETGLTIAFTYPSRIVMDSGDVTEGLDCWWIPVGKEEKIEVKTKRSKRLEGIQERFFKTTKGPWKTAASGDEHKIKIQGVLHTVECEDDCILTKDDKEVLGVSEWIRVDGENLEFMAHAWEDIRWLISEMGLDKAHKQKEGKENAK